jgi:hypothetical protein
MMKKGFDGVRGSWELEGRSWETEGGSQELRGELKWGMGMGGCDGGDDYHQRSGKSCKAVSLVCVDEGGGWGI